MNEMSNFVDDATTRSYPNTSFMPNNEASTNFQSGCNVWSRTDTTLRSFNYDKRCYGRPQPIDVQCCLTLDQPIIMEPCEVTSLSTNQSGLHPTTQSRVAKHGHITSKDKWQTTSKVIGKEGILDLCYLRSMSQPTHTGWRLVKALYKSPENKSKTP